MKKSCVFWGMVKIVCFSVSLQMPPFTRVVHVIGTAWVNGTLVEAVDSKYGEPEIGSSGCNHPRCQALAYGDAVDV